MLFFIKQLALELVYGSSYARPRHAYLTLFSMSLCQSESLTQWQGENKTEQIKKNWTWFI